MSYYFKFIFMIFFININSKTNFIAIELPDKFYRYIKTILKNDFKYNKKFYILLKDIGDINSYERDVIIKKLNKISEHICSHNISKTLKKSDFEIKNNYLKLKIKEDNWLKNLAIKLDSFLRDLVQEGKIVSVNRAVPREFYISLAKLENSTVNIKDIKKKFKENLDQNILINSFNLYRSDINKKPKILKKDIFNFIKGA